MAHRSQERRKTGKERRGVPPKERIRVPAVGLSCPLPVYKMKKALDQVASGDTVLLETDDPAVCREIRGMVRRLNLKLQEEIAKDGVVRLYVQKS